MTNLANSEPSACFFQNTFTGLWCAACHLACGLMPRGFTSIFVASKQLIQSAVSNCVQQHLKTAAVSSSNEARWKTVLVDLHASLSKALKSVRAPGKNRFTRAFIPAEHPHPRLTFRAVDQSQRFQPSGYRSATQCSAAGLYLQVRLQFL